MYPVNKRIGGPTFSKPLQISQNSSLKTEHFQQIENNEMLQQFTMEVVNRFYTTTDQSHYLLFFEILSVKFIVMFT